MDFGMAMATSADAWKLVQRAEALGFSHAWFYDTQMLSADCFVAMGAAAVKTDRIRLGTGVLIPTNRIAPVAANALATLNQLAPGRIDFGVGTGFTGRRAMGLGAMRLADLDDYLRVIYGLLDKQIVEMDVEGQRRKIQFLNPEVGLINTDDPIRLHISAYGPKSRALTVKWGAGWLNFIGDVASGVDAIDAMHRQWTEAGRSRHDLSATTFALGCVLQPGEPYDSPRAIAQAGPRAAVILHRAADEAIAGLPNSSGIPPAAAEAIHRYVDIAKRFEPVDARYLMNHRGHLMFVKPEERDYVTAELIRDTSFTATEPELKARIGALKEAGYTQFTMQIVPGQEAAIEDWGRMRKAFS
jgi:5,10-methylenetetrahydromethanopterin reductase